MSPISAVGQPSPLSPVSAPSPVTAVASISSVSYGNKGLEAFNGKIIAARYEGKDAFGNDVLSFKDLLVKIQLPKQAGQFSQGDTVNLAVALDSADFTSSLTSASDKLNRTSGLFSTNSLGSLALDPDLNASSFELSPTAKLFQLLQKNAPTQVTLKAMVTSLGLLADVKGPESDPSKQLPQQNIPLGELSGILDDTGEVNAKLLAQQLSSAVSKSGLFFESHIGKVISGQVSADEMTLHPQSAFDARDSLNNPNINTQDSAAVRIASSQLSMLNSNGLTIEMPGWFGDTAILQVARRPEQDHPTTQEEDPQASFFKISFDLPTLGKVAFSGSIQDQNLQLRIQASDQSASLIDQHASKLSEKLQALGINPSLLQEVHQKAP